MGGCSRSDDELLAQEALGIQVMTPDPVLNPPLGESTAERFGMKEERIELIPASLLQCAPDNLLKVPGLGITHQQCSCCPTTANSLNCY